MTTMAVTKRTVSIPIDLAEQVEKIAKKERLSFSGALSLLVDEALRRRGRRFKSWGAGDSGLGDLSIRTEEYLKEIFSKDFEH